MDHVKMEDGDLELLAMGLLQEDRAGHLRIAIQEDYEMAKEFLDVQAVFQRIAEENALQPPEELEGELFEKRRQGRVLKENMASPPETRVLAFLNTFVFRLAASVAVVCSLGFKLYQWEKDKKVASEQNGMESKQAFYASLPMSQGDFEDLTISLKETLKEEPCEGNYKFIRVFLIKNGYDADRVTGYFLNKEGGHCDCEVLHNIRAVPPQKILRHGEIQMMATLPPIDRMLLFAHWPLSNPLLDSFRFGTKQASNLV